jgi:hypothetical protein
VPALFLYFFSFSSFRSPLFFIPPRAFFGRAELPIFSLSSFSITFLLSSRLLIVLVLCPAGQPQFSPIVIGILAFPLGPPSPLAQHTLLAGIEKKWENLFGTSTRATSLSLPHSVRGNHALCCSYDQLTAPFQIRFGQATLGSSIASSSGISSVESVVTPEAYSVSSSFRPLFVFSLIVSSLSSPQTRKSGCILY